MRSVIHAVCWWCVVVSLSPKRKRSGEAGGSAAKPEAKKSSAGAAGAAGASASHAPRLSGKVCRFESRCVQAG